MPGALTATAGTTLLARSRTIKKEVDYAGSVIQRTQEHSVKRGWLKEFDA